MVETGAGGRGVSGHAKRCETKRAQSLAVGTCPCALPLVLSDEKESAGHQPALLASGRELEGARQTGMRTRDGPRAYSIIMRGPRELWCDLGVPRGVREWRQVKYGSLAWLKTNALMLGRKLPLGCSKIDAVHTHTY